MNGTRGFIDPRYRERIFLETRLLEIMDQCWEHDGDERVDIFAVVKSLNKLLDDNDKLQVENGYKKQSAPFVVNVTERDELDSSSSSE